MYRDYNLHKQIPEVFDTFGEAAAVLETVGRELKAISGEKSSFTAQLETFSYQLRKMVDRPDTVQKRVQELKSSLSSLVSWLINIRSNPLEIDYLVPVSYTHLDVYKRQQQEIQEIVEEDCEEPLTFRAYPQMCIRDRS